MRPSHSWSLCILIALSPVSAYAYIDPGTGSVLIQGIIAAVAAIGVTLKLYWHRFIGFFRKKPRDTAPEASAHDRAASEK